MASTANGFLKEDLASVGRTASSGTNYPRVSTNTANATWGEVAFKGNFHDIRKPGSRLRSNIRSSDL